MTSDEVRSAFLSFFEGKGHKTIPSSSLIPHGDPTLLLTTAGMVQFKPYFLGEALPPNSRLVSCQKCFRTTDIESVGDPTHLTFFEMLGNFSIGDYFKREAISWAWEFVIQRLSLSPERLWVTVFVDDDESLGIWREIGVPEQRILRLGEEDNFWGPAGNSGPCGPCSEIHYDFGKEVGCGKPSCAPNCNCGRFSEIWNLVFTQYNQDKDGQRIPLPKPNIDTGMGLERTAAVIQGKTSVYETDLFSPLLERISELSGKKYRTDDSGKTMRVIAEHSRGIAFLIADGVMPSNEGRGYVLRRLLRRAALFGRRLGLDKPFLAETAKTTIKQMGHFYPELVQRQDFIIKVIELEEVRFSETLGTGLELLDGIMAEATDKGRKRISGKQAFKLHDTHGFPIELTREIAADCGFSVDLAGFEREMRKVKRQQLKRQIDEVLFTLTPREQRVLQLRFGLKDGRSRTLQEVGKEFGLTGARIGQIEAKALRKLRHPSRSRKLKDYLELYDTQPVESFVGYKNLKYKSVVASILVDIKSAEIIQEGQEASLILESTPFYSEMGGQVGDTGEIHSNSGRFSVTNTIRVPPDIIVHQGRVTEGSLTVGEKVEAVVDKERRLDIARNHTATHLLQATLRQVLGENVQQRGSLVAPDRLRFDFSHLAPMSQEEIQEVQHIVNGKVRQNLKVHSEDIPYKKAIEEGAIALFGEKYGDVVRVVKIGEPIVSAELCGGTHVASTGEIGFFQIVGESSIGAGLRRIEAVTGRGAEGYIEKRLKDLSNIVGKLATEVEDVSDKVDSIIDELARERRQRQVVESELARIRAEVLLGQAEVVSGVRVLAARVPPSRMEVLREMCDLLRDRLKSGIIVLGTVYENKPAFVAMVTPDLVTRGYNAGEIVKQVAKVTGGGGGGKATLAQAGGKDKDKLDEALQLVRSLI